MIFVSTHSRSRCTAARLEEYRLPYRDAPSSSHSAVDPGLVVANPNNHLQHLWGRTCESGSKFTIEQRSSRLVIPMAAALVSRSRGPPPTHSSFSKGTDRSDAKRMFGRNRRTSGRCAAQPPDFVYRGGGHHEDERLVEDANGTSSRPANHCGDGPPSPVPGRTLPTPFHLACERASGASVGGGSPPLLSKENQLSGSLDAVSHGKPPRSSGRRKASDGRRRDRSAQVGDIGQFGSSAVRPSSISLILEQRLYFTDLDEHVRSRPPNAPGAQLRAVAYSNRHHSRGLSRPDHQLQQPVGWRIAHSIVFSI